MNPPGAFWSSGAARPVVWSGRLWWRCLHFNALGIAQFNGTTLSVLNAPPWANSEPVIWNSALYYGAQDTTYGNELWRYNGSAAQRVADLNPNGDSNPSGFATFRGALYFAADDGVHGSELMRYNGTSVSLAADVNPNPIYELGGDRLSDSNPSALTVCNDALYFIAWDGTNTGVRRFDGTNTVVLGGGMLNAAAELVVFQGGLYFDADDGRWGRELWRVETNAQPRLEIARRGTVVEVHLNEAETGRFVIEASSNFQRWTPLTTNRPMDGRITLTDPLAAESPRRVYRAVRAGPH